MWFGPVLATSQDLVVPRLHGIAFANITLGTILIGLGLGPYMVGLISDVTGDLRTALLSVILVFPVALIAVAMTMRHLRKGEAMAAQMSAQL